VGIPRYNDPGPNSTRATSVQAEPVKESDVVFEVTAESTGGEVTELPVHPLDREPEFSWGADSFSEPYFYDESQPTRKPFTNSAYEPFDTTWERVKSDLTITMIRNEPIWDV